MTRSIPTFVLAAATIAVGAVVTLAAAPAAVADDVYGPWEQTENSDYDEQRPSSGDSHEDEFDDEYGEQRPKGDPNQPDNSLEDAHQADIEYWEGVARAEELARSIDRDASIREDAAARAVGSVDRDASVTADAAARAVGSVDRDASVLGSLDPDDFDRVDSVDIGPPTPVSARVGPDVASGPYFDPAVALRR
ncbi:MAG: hypothetical protein WAL26_27860 [Mycobacterium sp.]